MKNYKEVVGIDVSKKTIDAYCYQAQVHKEFKNDIVGYKSLLNWVLKVSKGVLVFYCFENTGYYSLKLALYLMLETWMLISLLWQKGPSNFFIEI